MENKKEYIISFGDSNEYRISVAAGSDRLEDIKEKISETLADKFPTLNKAQLYDKMNVKEVETSDAANYAAIPEFDADAATRFIKVLSADTNDYEDTKSLNTDAPWSNI